MKANVTIVKINPQEAEKMLGTQVREQRPIRDSHVKNLATDMKEGNFRLSADALVIIKGALANGQHRLWAVIESNTKQEFLLMETDDDELYKVLDCGLKRTVADGAHVTNGVAISGIANLFMAHRQGRLTYHGFTKKASRIEMIEFIRMHNDKMQQAHAYVRGIVSKTVAICPPSVPCALMLLTEPLHGTKSHSFVEAVYHGSNPGTICHELRDRCIKMRMARGSVASQYYLALFIKAFNAFATGSSLVQLKISESELYPQVAKPKKES